MYILLAILLFVSVGSPANLIPRFKDYPVERIFAGSPAQPRFSSPAQLLPGGQIHENDLLPDADPRYRETVEYDAAHGPNFAGRYTISKWSCGTGCASIVIIDAVSGT